MKLKFLKKFLKKFLDQNEREVKQYKQDVEEVLRKKYGYIGEHTSLTDPLHDKAGYHCAMYHLEDLLKKFGPNLRKLVTPTELAGICIVREKMDQRTMTIDYAVGSGYASSYEPLRPSIANELRSRAEKREILQLMDLPDWYDIYRSDKIPEKGSSDMWDRNLMKKYFLLKRAEQKLHYSLLKRAEQKLY